MPSQKVAFSPHFPSALVTVSFTYFQFSTVRLVLIECLKNFSQVTQHTPQVIRVRFDAELTRSAESQLHYRLRFLVAQVFPSWRKRLVIFETQCTEANCATACRCLLSECTEHNLCYTNTSPNVGQGSRECIQLMTLRLKNGWLAN